ncbi:type II secretion system F family protein [candidate division KSB1 bacterium]|nr:type II secretion system F family protein [candidate division KSB1 bacterium]
MVKSNKINPQLEKFLLKVSQFSKQDTIKVSRLKQTLIQAGYYQENSFRIFLSTKILSAIILFLVLFYFGLIARKPMQTVILLSFLMSIIGYLFPNYFLNVKVRKRQSLIASALPDALDLLVICVEAGLALNAAILRVGQELRLRYDALSEEFLLVNQELRTGIAREEALRHLADRNKVENLRILVGALILADRLGTSIADTLRAQADSLRTRVRQLAEEQAAKAGVKMLFPLVFFIMPALLIILLGPGFIAIIKNLSAVVQK